MQLIEFGGPTSVSAPSLMTSSDNFVTLDNFEADFDSMVVSRDSPSLDPISTSPSSSQANYSLQSPLVDEERSTSDLQTSVTFCVIA
ncbi:hypothetical protein CVT24_001965 [Panaeolus cyanescens]|uniref:Uncharacterized protein n=1 Tax=Panaeolus cyanescens TaxID=181874 RepID=A0A409YHQ8_9AGAR|nr:hypothetical protein CVT24_001965 [Panaeolus cyanescens]